MTLNLCLAGATGWAGSELARGIAGASDLTLVSAVSRTHAGKTLGDVLGDTRLSAPVFGRAADALARPCDVFVEYTTAASAKSNVVTALQHGTHVVVGASGLTDADFGEIDAVARERRRGVLACGNFALTVVLLQKFAEMAAKHIPHWEVIELRLRGQTGRSERHRARARHPHGEGASTRDRGSGCEDHRTAGGPWRRSLGDAGPLPASSGLRPRRRSDLRHAGPDLEPSAQRGDQREALRGRCAAGDTESFDAGGGLPWARCGARHVVAFCWRCMENPLPTPYPVGLLSRL